MDLFFSLSLLVVAASIAAAYAVRAAFLGPARHARVDADGRSPLLGRGPVEMMYWSVVPLAGAIARAGISADAVTWASLVLGGGAGLALARGHFGAGAFLAAISAAGDAVDGFVARATGTACERGEVLDAAVDRYVEFSFLAGVAIAFRSSGPLLVLTLAALVGSFMVSQSSARAQALGVEPPRGPMRRTDRAVVLIAGATLTPVVAWWSPSWGAAPMAAAVALVASLGNLSAMTRFAAIRARVEGLR